MTEGREEGMAVVDSLAQMLRDSESFINRSRSGNAVNQSLFGGDLVGATAAGMGGLLTGAGPSVPLMAAGAGLIARPIISKLMASALTSPSLNKALVALSRKYGDQLPATTESLTRALIAAGADQREVQEIFGDENGVGR
jgi:hypothetical protein